MDTAWGLTILVLGLLAWGGQTLTALSRPTAIRFGLTEPPSDIDPAFDADVRGEAPWDLLTLWTLPLAGLLLVLDEPNWAFLGIAGGAIYLYFGGRGIAQRMAMGRSGIPVGSVSSVRTATGALAIWATAGLVTIVIAAGDLSAAT